MAHLSKFAVNFNLIIMSKPKYIVILAGLFMQRSGKQYLAFLPVSSVNDLALVEILVRLL